jgi:hypothetical protein
VASCASLRKPTASSQPLTTRSRYLLIAAAAAAPRLAVLLHERSAITSAYVDKSDHFAQTFVSSGTFGFIPGEPSAYTQPLYGFFLVPIYWIFGRSWETVGLAQIAVAVLTALVVYELGRRVFSARVGLIAALLTTLHPYPLWHDVHMNREILDGLIGASIALLALLCAERLGRRRVAALGFVLGVATLSNARLIGLPVLVGGYLLWRHGHSRAVAGSLALLVGVFALTLAPWVVRNKVSVGCFAVTTDSRALWKANNANTFATLQRGAWIDDVPRLPGDAYTPQETFVLWQQTGKVVHVDECAAMHKFQHLVWRFWVDHPGEKAELAAQAGSMLWQPSAHTTEGRLGRGTWIDRVRKDVEPAYMIPVFVLAAAGLLLAPRRYSALALALLGYQTAVAMLFAGDTRYRVPWDFLGMVLAAASLVWIAARVSARRPVEPGLTPVP